MPAPLSLMTAPSNGVPVEIEPGLLWLRLALPFRLNHVNVYLLADRDGWLLIDTGPGNPETEAVWSALLDGGPTSPLRGRPITRILVTHHHPDHVGAAAYLVKRTGAPLLMGEIEYLMALHLVHGAASASEPVRMDFYRQNGVRGAGLDHLAGHLDRYRQIVPALPDTFVPLRDGDRIETGDHCLSVLEVSGHSPAQAILHEKTRNIVFVADQVLTRITPNVGVTDRSPSDDTLGRFLASLARLRAVVPDGGLVLPGHHLPFRSLHARTLELEQHHAARCDTIRTACTAGTGLTAAELIPILFPFELDAHQFWFALTEVLAHLNHLGARGELEPRVSHGARRWGRISRPVHTG